MTNELFEKIITKVNFSLLKKTPVILQSEAAECGIACLAMVCGHYGLDIDLFNFRQRFGSPSQGVTLMSLSKTAEHAGLKSRALSLDLDEIRQLKLPCVLHWGMNHYVVLTKVRKSSFVVHDPALGKRIIGNQEMSNYFTGKIIGHLLITNDALAQRWVVYDKAGFTYFGEHHIVVHPPVQDTGEFELADFIQI